MDTENKQQDRKEETKDNSEKILIMSAFVMAAIIVGYNAFFVPPVNNEITISGDLVSDSNYDEISKNSSVQQIKNQNININVASEEELVELEGVGPKMAKRIIVYRETHGGFSKKEEIMNVKGIGEKIYEKFKDDITVK